MTAETHELESVSSFGKDDDASFVPNYLNKKSRTGSLMQKAKYAVASRVSPADNPHGVEDGRFSLTCDKLDRDAHMLPQLPHYAKPSFGS